jgi:site-specific recombinase XerD
MATTSFPELLQRFFAHLSSAREVSPNTTAAYRDTFRLLLPFMAKRRRISVDQITLEAFVPDIILGFLEHLQRDRHNTARTRNARLAGIRAFVRFAVDQAAPDFIAQAQRLLAIPSKRADRPLLGFLTRKEVYAILSAPDLSTWTGKRDHLLFSLLYNTGARISEALQITLSDVRRRMVRLHGKGRKERDVPLWRQTERELRRWCEENKIPASASIFCNRNGHSISRRNANRRFDVTLAKATASCLSLRERKITLHTWRHTTAMHLLQAGVPLEVIGLWLGHEDIGTTHAYIEADLEMKEKALKHLPAPTPWRRPRKLSSSHVLAFLEAL